MLVRKHMACIAIKAKNALNSNASQRKADDVAILDLNPRP